MPKLIASDLDGTLLNSGGVICKESLQHLSTLHQMGVYFAIATGRPLASTLSVLETNHLIESSPFPEFLIIEEREVYVREGDRFVSWEPHNSEYRSLEARLIPHVRAIFSQAEDELRHRGWRFREFPDEMITARSFSALLFDDAEQALRAETLIRDFVSQSPQPLRISRNKSELALRSPSTGKGNAIARLAQRLAFDPQDVLAMGDSGNDVSMLDGEQGFQVATVANADQPIKEVVTQNGGYIASKPRSDGVAEILRCVIEALQSAS